jgi:hypothetical protein
VDLSAHGARMSSKMVIDFSASGLAAFTRVTDQRASGREG